MALDIKICGLKTHDAIAAALAGGASHVGFIFFPKSPRNVAPADAARLREAASGRASAVAVTVDASDAEMEAIVAAMAPDMLQLHGKETPARVAAVRQRYGLPVMKAIPIREAADLAQLDSYRFVADRLLLDAKPPSGAELPGGNGIPFDWTLLEGLEGKVDYLLSGGINAGNVAEALRVARPRGIDVSSGVESAPGVKDAGLIEAFFEALRATGGQRAA